MKCALCGKKEATLHIQEIVDTKRKEMHLCQECADRSGVLHTVSTLDFSLDALVKQGEGAPQKNDVAKIACSVCGFDLAALREENSVGCSNCYEEFRSAFDRLLGAKGPHKGRAPFQNRKAKIRETRIERLTKKLNAFLQSEDYERAAEIRDALERIDDGTRDT